ncbi:glycoside hydrolase domain-containing protein [Nakamurella endophytica]|uniref:Rv2525c-like glycoside hydrolase-like domain-containing protein n=1 Tax=Nakamurella endophytica TaxID=1748367 RepID=A0A917WFT1_9ACTN|nr:glycoside hydrolase domain-containing protein [Nakamurella endophytica]GGM00698.1 hypothetical protein GCM10011594_20990 [Nakamurella endophytica]
MSIDRPRTPGAPHRRRAGRLLRSVTAAALAAGAVLLSPDVAAAAPAPAPASPVAPVAASPVAPAAASPAAPATVRAAAAGPAVRFVIGPGRRGFDSSHVETPAQLACLRNAGYAFTMIHVTGTAWRAELAAAKAITMHAVLYQGYDPSAWPTATMGTERGTIVAQKARQAGYPAGAQIFLDLEDTTTASAATLRTWVANWARAVSVRGYVPAVYVGVPQRLTAAQISALPGVQVFWRSASGSAPQVARGYVVRQTAVLKGACRIPGGIDTDVSGTDAAGHRLIGQG